MEVDTLDLFRSSDQGAIDVLGPRAFVLRAFALPFVEKLLAAIAVLEQASPFRQMVTPGGFTMSVARLRTPLVSRASGPMPVWSIATRQGRGCRCIKTE